MRKQATTLSLLFVACIAQAEEGYSAKSLFFGANDTVLSASTGESEATKPVVAASGAIPGKAPVVATSGAVPVKAVASASQKKSNSPARMGMSYFIRLKNPDGSTRDVLASQKFKSGDRFQLAVKVNRPSYVYILNEAPDGNVTQIYPQPGADNFVNAMGTVFFPSRGAFEFDEQSGAEQLLVYLSPVQLQAGPAAQMKTRVPDLVSGSRPYLTQTQLPACASKSATAIANAPAAVAPAAETPAVADASTQIASLDSAYAAKAIVVSGDAEPDCAAAASASPAAYASKAITFSDDPAPPAGQQVASYLVKTAADKNDGLYLKLKLERQ